MSVQVDTINQKSGNEYKSMYIYFDKGKRLFQIFRLLNSKAYFKVCSLYPWAHIICTIHTKVHSIKIL